MLNGDDMNNFIKKILQKDTFTGSFQTKKSDDIK